VGEYRGPIQTSILIETKKHDILGGVVIPVPIVFTHVALEHTPQGNQAATEAVWHYFLFVGLLVAKAAYLRSIGLIDFAYEKDTFIFGSLQGLYCLGRHGLLFSFD
jgi:hypothetical protein